MIFHKGNVNIWLGEQVSDWWCKREAHTKIGNCEAGPCATKAFQRGHRKRNKTTKHCTYCRLENVTLWKGKRRENSKLHICTLLLLSLLLQLCAFGSMAWTYHWNIHSLVIQWHLSLLLFLSSFTSFSSSRFFSGLSGQRNMKLSVLVALWHLHSLYSN